MKDDNNIFDDDDALDFILYEKMDKHNQGGVSDSYALKAPNSDRYEMI